MYQNCGYSVNGDTQKILVRKTVRQSSVMDVDLKSGIDFNR